MSSREGSGIVDLHHDSRFRQSDSLYFTVRANDPRAELLAEDIELLWDGRVYYIAEPVALREGSEATVEIEALALWNRLADDRKIGAFELEAITVFDGLGQILAGTGWTATLDDPTIDAGTPFFLTSNDASILDLLRKWAKITGLELTFDTIGKRVALVTQVGANLGLGFRYGRNVMNVERRSKPPIATVVYPFGLDGIGIEGVEPSGLPYVEDFSFYTAQGISLVEARARYTRKQTFSDTTFVTDGDLYAEALRRIATVSQPQVSYTMDVLDLTGLIGATEPTVRVGDRVRVTDEVLGYDITVRVVRVDRYPLDPSRSVVELSYLEPAVPDPNVGSGRGDPADEWILFEYHPKTLRQIRQGLTTLNRLDLQTKTGAQWVVGYSINGIGVGTGTVTLTATDEETGDLLAAPQTIPVTNGTRFHASFTFGRKEISAGFHSFRVRASSSGAGIGANIAANDSAIWALARRTTGRTVKLPNSQAFGFTGAIQYFTVPADVSEITLTVIGGSGGRELLATGGGGAKVVVQRSVIAGEIVDVYVGGTGQAGGLGWPNGGAGDVTASGNSGEAGGGSSHVVSAGGVFADAWVVAGGGGASGFAYGTATFEGGYGGFYLGGAGIGGLYPGGGATQETAGIGVGGGGDGAANAGGIAGDTVNAFAGPGGGGGGGRFGGAGAGIAGFSGSGGEGGPGGGGSGWMDEHCFDVQFDEGFNETYGGHGSILFEWATPIP